MSPYYLDSRWRSRGRHRIGRRPRVVIALDVNRVLTYNCKTAICKNAAISRRTVFGFVLTQLGVQDRGYRGPR